MLVRSLAKHSIKLPLLKAHKILISVAQVRYNGSENSHNVAPLFCDILHLQTLVITVDATAFVRLEFHNERPGTRLIATNSELVPFQAVLIPSDESFLSQLYRPRSSHDRPPSS